MGLPDVETRSFFTRFKERLHQEGNKDPGGRYFSVLLEQVFHEVPDVLAKLLFPACRPRQFRHPRVQTDFPYDTGRLADLATRKIVQMTRLFCLCDEASAFGKQQLGPAKWAVKPT
jgi:hypothetical protein